MAKYVFSNAPAAAAMLAGGGVNASATTFTLSTGDGAKLPSPAAGEIALCRIEDEYFTYTSRSGDILSGITRGAEGSTAASHAAGVEIRNVVSAGVLSAVQTQALDNLSDVAISGAADGQFLQRVSGTFVNAYQYVWVSFVIDGGGSAITTGVKGDFVVPAGTIVEARLLADQSGSIVIDLWKDTYANFPPTVADTITASAKPTLSSATKSQDTTLTGWTTATADGDVLRVNVDSVATVTRVSLGLRIRR